MTEETNIARIGIFLCKCSGCIARTIDLQNVLEFASSLKNVVSVQIGEALCSDEGIDEMRKAIGLYSMNKIVLGACSPLLYLSKFKTVLGNGSPAKIAVDMANLREQCSMVHSKLPRMATVKACDQLAMIVAKANALGSSEEGGSVALLEPCLCDGCGVCRTVCRTNSVQIVSDPDRRWKRIAQVNLETCNDCGACVVACPNGAKDLISHLDAQVMAQIDSISSRGFARDIFAPKVIVFTCNWCTYFSADLAGIMRLELPTEFRSIRVPCCAEIEPEWIIKAFARGIDGILVMSGSRGSCRHENAIGRVRKRIALLNAMLAGLRLGDKRLKMCWITPQDAEEYRREVTEFTNSIVAIGPNPIRLKVWEIEGVGRVPEMVRRELESDQASESDEDVLQDEWGGPTRV
ncbi:MAG: hydrogenase iron-sulfur subunit [Methanomassiliicoccales archaeon]|nr:hydrogenase iron-sulfur subunit [Methanomassiliicoccales archaeon]